MNQSTCTIVECERPAHSRGWCSMHYKRWAAHGDPTKTLHTESCSVDECEMKHAARGYCRKHYERWKRHGDPNQRVRGVNSGPCSYNDCASPMRRGGLCSTHYGILRREGRLRSLKYRWAERRASCLECEGPMAGDFASREYCSPPCAARSYRHGKARPTEARCARCAAVIDLRAVGKRGRVRRADVAVCEDCRHSKYSMTAREIALRDGEYCSICGEHVDMTLKRPASLFGPSVDHVIPRALGGGDGHDNLALAHYWCNAVKSDRLNFQII